MKFSWEPQCRLGYFSLKQVPSAPKFRNSMEIYHRIFEEKKLVEIKIELEGFSLFQVAASVG